MLPLIIYEGVLTPGIGVIKLFSVVFPVTFNVGITLIAGTYYNSTADRHNENTISHLKLLIHFYLQNETSLVGMFLPSCPDCSRLPPDELSGVLRILRSAPQRMRESVRKRSVPRLLRERHRHSACGFLRDPLDPCGDHQITRHQVKGSKLPERQ